MDSSPDAETRSRTIAGPSLGWSSGSMPGSSMPGSSMPGSIPDTAPELCRVVIAASDAGSQVNACGSSLAPSELSRKVTLST